MTTIKQRNEGQHLNSHLTEEKIAGQKQFPPIFSRKQRNLESQFLESKNFKEKPLSV